MSWHYRAIREKLIDGSWCYSVGEWYKDTYGKGEHGWTTYNYATGDTKKELIEDLEMMLEDIKRHKTFTEPTKPQSKHKGEK